MKLIRQGLYMKYGSTLHGQGLGSLTWS